MQIALINFMCDFITCELEHVGNGFILLRNLPRVAYIFFIDNRYQDRIQNRAKLTILLFMQH